MRALELRNFRSRTGAIVSNYKSAHALRLGKWINNNIPAQSILSFAIHDSDPSQSRLRSKKHGSVCFILPSLRQHDTFFTARAEHILTTLPVEHARIQPVWLLYKKQTDQERNDREDRKRSSPSTTWTARPWWRFNSLSDIQLERHASIKPPSSKQERQFLREFRIFLKNATKKKMQPFQRTCPAASTTSIPFAASKATTDCVWLENPVF